jgi:AcrR family transcriptional regulator
VSERRRLTAAERREQLLTAAMAEFGEKGYHGASTETIAELAGISQPYVFRLYGTKKELFLACVERCFDRTLEVFRRAASEDEPIRAMGRAYVEMLGDRDLVLMQHQTYAAAADADVREVARRRFEELGREIERLGGISRDDRNRFVGQGMLLNVITAIGAEPEEWVFLSGPAT